MKREYVIKHISSKTYYRGYGYYELNSWYGGWNKYVGDAERYETKELALEDLEKICEVNKGCDFKLIKVYSNNEY